MKLNTFTELPGQNKRPLNSPPTGYICPRVAPSPPPPLGMVMVSPPVGVGAPPFPSVGVGVVDSGGSKIYNHVSTAPARVDRKATCTNLSNRSPKHLANAAKHNFRFLE